jgi:hypothetical protein
MLFTDFPKHILIIASVLRGLGVQARQDMSESEYWGHVRGLWDERQAVIQKVYEQMVKTDELLTTLINTLSDAHTRPHHGEHVVA